ncbi:MAG: hypothetical protein KKC05_03100 [Nanoarchaeota archaeon]|nr:hypothetical protein [Nanoarchaeota archaeon]
MRASSHVTAILALTMITIAIGGTASVLLFNTFEAYSQDVKLSQPVTIPCDLEMEIIGVCFTEDVIRITMTNLKNKRITTNSQLIIEGSLFTAIVPFNPPHIELKDQDFITLEINYKPGVLGTVKRISVEPKIETSKGDISCDPAVHIIEEQKMCQI